MGGKTIRISGFPSRVTPTEVTAFLEKHTGEGSVIALKLNSPKNSRVSAIVQFTRKEDAQDLTVMTQQKSLSYDRFHLRARDVERDIIAKPRKPSFVLENVILLLGCPLSHKRLSVLWSAEDVKVSFGLEVRNIFFSLTHEGRSYELEVAHESIREIHLHRSLPQRPKFLVIQVVAAPKIYQIPLGKTGSLQEDPKSYYFRDPQDEEQWVRTTDFSPSRSIGQSCALCLQLPFDCNLPNIQDFFVPYTEVEGSYDLKKGSSYSSNLDLVPVVEPRAGVKLPYTILFKINHLVQNGTLSAPTLNRKFYSLCCPSASIPTEYIERALEMMSTFDRSCFDPAGWLKEQYAKFRNSGLPVNSPTISLDSSLVYVHRVQVTPSKVYFYGPEINVSNRILRQYHSELDNFLRVSFVDEDGEKMHSADILSRSASADDNNRTALYWRILSTLRNGITVGDKKFEFLAFSSSQLRESSAWMFASSGESTADSIRRRMGKFSKIRNVAKYAARLGQSFGSSTETMYVNGREVECIPDVEREGYVFSDGIGKISPKFAGKVAAKCGLKSSVPSAFQIRYAGYKGVVAVDPASTTAKLSLRRSMSKFDSESTKLDVLAYSKYQPCFLNRQLITLLSTLGVEDEVFERKMEEAVNDLDKILSDPERAREAVHLMSPGERTGILRELLSCGYKLDAEPFLSMLLQAFRASRLLELRTKARIFVPQGRAMMGCLDETASLEYGQVFVQVSRRGSNEGLLTSSATVLEGKVVVAKNPCLHPGDVRVLSAVDVPDLHHMIDCVVFPQKGERPHPDECSGGDLDGDIYFVSWDSELIPPRVVAPMEYTPAPTNELDHDVTIEEVMEYFANYIVNDSLGIIANAHTVFADKESNKAASKECIKLAKLFSVAVDFPKTGVAATIPRRLLAKEFPDFMEKLGRDTYESQGILGKLYRATKACGFATVEAVTKEVGMRSYDPDMEVDGFKEYVDEAFGFKVEYDFKLGNLMDHYGIKTEAEIIGGHIMNMSKMFTKKKDGEAVGRAVRSLRKEARSWFDKQRSDRGDHDEDEEYAKKASAWYYVTYHPNFWGCYNVNLNRPHFLSFPWCVCEKLAAIKRRKKTRQREGGSQLLLQQ
ncbi:hypothetical protein OPV22_029148 [Ensete ventricosum]|uniref:RNA-dependent RNA polymerase n=1 Tax=Ensete ventricosum TaxID=4639 RepID=A0AAV8QAH4_ENSVE|nr:hypothetical protein OPV22_029148 [Ensete ventricosum]